MSEYLETPLNLNVRGIAPVNMYLVAYVMQQELSKRDSYPAVFDYKIEDSKGGLERMVSFVVYKNKQGLTIKEVGGKQREKYLEDMHYEQEKKARKKSNRKGS